MSHVGLRSVRGFLGCTAAAIGFCSLAAAQAPFTEEALARGLDHYVVPQFSIWHGCGVAFADLDNDGDPDVVSAGGFDGVVGVFENDGSGHFIDRRTGSGIPLLDAASAVVAFDYDADGLLDLYLTQGDSSVRGNILVRNLGGFTFADVTTAAGVGDLGPGTGSAVGDSNGDGWLDLFVPNYGTADRFFRNLGDGTFEEVSAELGLDSNWRSFQGIFFDMDLDGDADLYVSVDKKDLTESVQRNSLYRNDGGTLVDVSLTSGAGIRIYSMGVGVGDFDGNGYQDIYCTNLGIEANKLLLGGSGGQFQEAEATAGVESFRTGWGALFFDYDNDTNQDLYVCNADSNGLSPINRMFLNDGRFPCRDAAPELGVDDAGRSFSVATADIEGDGDLDLLVQDDFDALKLYVNHEGENRNWVAFRIAGTGPNTFAVGARVSIRVGSQWQHRQILGGGNGFLGQNDLTVHFGLGAATEVDEVRVHWPDGPRRTLIRVPANQTHEVGPAVIRPSSDVPVPVTRRL